MDRKLPKFVMPFIVLIAVIGIAGILRSGHYLALWSFYQFAGIKTDAVVVQVEKYKAKIRNGRVRSYVDSYRGTYGFDVSSDNGTAGHFTGRFDSLYSDKPVSENDKIPVLYSRFDPSLSLPEHRHGTLLMMVMLVVFLLSLFALFLSIVFFKFMKTDLEIYPRQKGERHASGRPGKTEQAGS